MQRLRTAALALTVAGLALTSCSSSSTTRAAVGVPQPVPNRLFAAAAPTLLFPAGPGPGPQQAPCQPGAIATSAQLSGAVDGVLGLITITGQHCSLQVDPVGIRLLDDAGKPLKVAAGSVKTVNFPDPPETDRAEAAGSVRVGFAWTGSYCGPPARSVEIPALPAAVRIPLTGASPACQGAADSRLIPGVVSYPNSPVEPPATAWKALRARVVLPKSVKPGVVPVTLILTNTGTTDISLAAPCPTYDISVTVPTAPGPRYGAFEQTGGPIGDLCAGVRVVRPSHPLTIQLPAVTSLTEDPNSPWRTGGTVQLQWAMAGVPTAQGSALIQ